MANLGKTQRQHRIIQILEAQPVANQTDLLERLRAGGVEVTQATLSRDLDELGAMKMRIPGGVLAYAIPEPGQSAQDHSDRLRHTFTEFVVDVVAAGQLILIKTPPGTANVIGYALDHHPVEGVLGTVCGDDTTLVISQDVKTAASVTQSFRTLAGLSR